MVYFEWNSQVKLGHPFLDEQHKRLFSLSEAVAQTLANRTEHRAVAQTLQALVDFAREHFAAEEALIRGANYPCAQAHAKIHASLLVELEDYCRKVQQEDNPNLTLTGLVTFLGRWLILHIDSTDRQIVGWLLSH